MATISLCMIVKDEEDVIGRCLESIKDLVDEIIVADTGSTDKTKEIVSKYTDKLYDYPWRQDFASARNFVFEKALMDYQMWLDADDVLTEEDRERFRELKDSLDSRVDIVMMKYHVGFDQEGRPSMTYYRERLMKRERGFRWEGKVHESIQTSGKLLYSEAAVSHKKIHPADPDRNLNIYRSMIEHGEKLEPRHTFYYARELYYHKQFEEAASQFLYFLDEGKGWKENNISACMDLAECYRSMGCKHLILPALFRSFAYDIPRAEACCAIGLQFMENHQYPQAIYWYQEATGKIPEPRSGGFVLADCYGFIPYMQLCVCYFRLGDTKTARQYHKMAQELKPYDPSVQYNESYFSSREIIS